MNNNMNENTKVTKDVENVEETKVTEVTETMEETKEMETTDVNKGEIDNIGETAVVKMKYVDISESVIHLIKSKINKYVNETYKQYFDRYEVKVKITNRVKIYAINCLKWREMT